MKLAAQGMGGCRGRIEESPNIFFCLAIDVSQIGVVEA